MVLCSNVSFILIYLQSSCSSVLSILIHRNKFTLIGETYFHYGLVTLTGILCDLCESLIQSTESDFVAIGLGREKKNKMIIIILIPFKFKEPMEPIRVLHYTSKSFYPCWKRLCVDITLFLTESGWDKLQDPKVIISCLLMITFS